MSSPGNEEHPAVDSGSSSPRRPGHELGAARERAGVSVEEMAQRLNLGRASVEALERDDYEHLPTAAFVRGYLRAYAKEVGMDGDALVAEFDAVVGGADTPELVVSEGVPDPGSGHGHSIAILVLVAVVVIGAGTWWYQQPAVSPPAEPESSAVTDDSDPVEPDTGEETSADDGDAGTGGQGANDNAEKTAADTVEQTATDTDTDAGGDADADADADAQAVDAGDETATSAEPQGDDADGAQADGAVDGDAARDAQATLDTDGSVDAPADTEDAVAEEAGDSSEDNGATDTATAEQAESAGPLATSDAELAATSAADTGPDRLEITVDGKSWIEVYDSRDRRLVYTLYSGSSPVTLNGWAPFEVFLGNSPAVTVRVGDRVIDQSAFVRSDNTARFLADSEGARQR